jgi:hypothetical protein
VSGMIIRHNKQDIRFHNKNVLPNIQNDHQIKSRAM